jgi:hypothetical protein
VTQALTSEPRNLEQCLDGFITTLRRLSEEWAITVEHAALPACDLGEFDPATRTVRIRHDAPLEDQLTVISDVWWLLTFGPHATRSARRQPHLQLVPTPRTGS